MQTVWCADRGKYYRASLYTHLDDLEEDRGSVANGLGEDLHQDALVVLVNQNAQLLNNSELLLRERIIRAQLHLHALIVVVRLTRHELKAAPRGGLHHQLHGSVDVVGHQSHMLNTLAL